MCWYQGWFHRQQVTAHWSRCCSQGRLWLSFEFEVSIGVSVQQVFFSGRHGLQNYQASGDVAVFEWKKRVQLLCKPCVGYSMGATAILWVTEKSEREPFILPFILLYTLSIPVWEELNASAAGGTLVVLHTGCNCRVSLLQTSSHSPPGQGSWVALRKFSCCSLTSPVAVKSNGYWTLFAPLSSKAPHTCTSVGSAPKQTELSVWALLPVGFVFILFLHNSVEHFCLSCLCVESSQDAGAASIHKDNHLEKTRWWS